MQSTYTLPTKSLKMNIVQKLVLIEERKEKNRQQITVGIITILRPYRSLIPPQHNAVNTRPEKNYNTLLKW